MNLIFDEIESYCFSGLSYKEKYARLYRLLDRVCKQLTADEPTDFSNLFARLYFLCAQKGIPSQSIEIFRIHARQVLQSRHFPYTDEDYLYDVKALCETLGSLLHTPVSPRLSEMLPAHWRPLPHTHYTSEKKKRIRMVVESWNKEFLYGFDEACPAHTPLQVSSCMEAFPELNEILFKGAQLNLLSVTSDEAGTLQAELIVFEPDYLVDISSLSACYTNYGDTPLNYLMNKFRPQENTPYILLGNAANQFLDDCINESDEAPASFDSSIQKAFRTDLLAYCSTPQIDREYFRKAKEQFSHIRQTLDTLFHTPSYRFSRNKVMLEPSFLCECMGLQGRMDLLQSDGKNLIELKSGKADGWNGNLRAKASHALQMALYKEILYYNLDIPREEVRSYLFYSAYPKLYAERSAKGQIQKAISLRNRIVANEIRLKQGEGEALLESLTPDSFNERNDQSKLWRDYQRPQIERWLLPFRQASPLEKTYFFHFLSFMEKEQFLSKTGDAQPDSSRGFSDIWNADLATKQEGGNILTDLTIKSMYEEKGPIPTQETNRTVTSRTEETTATGTEETIAAHQNAGEKEGIGYISLAIPFYDESFLPNFRKGDIVLLYERNGETDDVTNRQVFRGNIESISDTELSVKLRYKQRNRQVFNPSGRYAVEHDFMDGAYNTVYRGLYTFLTAPAHRKELLLCQRSPRMNPTRILNGHYLNRQIDQIVLQAKQAEDYFLLVGPPGTGKTSVALKSMVEEFYAEPSSQLLLLSYTNRAVDEICDMLERIESHPAYLRIGSELSCEERFRPRLMQHTTESCRDREEIVRKVAGIRIVVGTTASISGKPELFKLKHFQVAIIDEASQILEPHLLGILCTCHDTGQCAIDKFILIGDPKQLPAVVQQSPAESAVHDERLIQIGLTDRRNSLFERIYRWLHAHPQPGILSMLNRQGRMHPEVNDFPNRFFYGGQLDIVPVKHQTEDIEFRIYPQREKAFHLSCMLPEESSSPHPKPLAASHCKALKAPLPEAFSSSVQHSSSDEDTSSSKSSRKKSVSYPNTLPKAPLIPPHPLMRDDVSFTSPHAKTEIESERLHSCMQWVATTRVGFIPSGFPPLEDSNKINRNEAQIIALLVHSIYELCLLNGLPFRAAQRIGIIVPFRNQIALIGKALKALRIPGTEEITIDTVERYQGSQREIILFSTTISQPYQLDILSAPVEENDGTLIDRKLNVALTRAQKQLFVTGNETILRHSPLYKEFIERYSIKDSDLYNWDTTN